MRYCFIINQNSNLARSNRRLSNLKTQIKLNFPNAVICITLTKEEAKSEIQLHLADTDVFVACGGDGTIQFIASQLIGTHKLLGILPIGSGNDFAKLLSSKSSDLNPFFDILKYGHAKPVDLLRINKVHYCINTFGIGFDGLANEKALKVKYFPSALKYMSAAFASLFALEKFTTSIKYESRKPIITTTFMMVITNGKWEGGRFFISPESIPTDGVAEFGISTALSKFQLLKQLIKLSLGRQLSTKEIQRESFTNMEIELESDQVAHIDGEVILLDKLNEISVLPGVVRVLF